MSDETDREARRGTIPRLVRALEFLTGCVLLQVLAVLGWITLAAYRPDWGRVAPLDVEVAAVVLLLTAALGLVSLLALVHTRR